MEQNLQKRITVLGILVTDLDAVEKVNAVLHEKSALVLGRMGLPLRDRGVNAITLVLDATADDVNALTGKLGKINGVTAKALFGKI